MTNWMTATDHRKEVARIKRDERKKRHELQKRLATALGGLCVLDPSDHPGGKS